MLLRTCRQGSPHLLPETSLACTHLALTPLVAMTSSFFFRFCAMSIHAVAVSSCSARKVSNSSAARKSVSGGRSSLHLGDGLHFDHSPWVFFLAHFHPLPSILKSISPSNASSCWTSTCTELPIPCGRHRFDSQTPASKMCVAKSST